MITDFHSHILAKIDDGSKSVEESIQLLEKEVRQGVDTVVLTPHFYAQKMSFDKFIKTREESVRELRKCAANLLTKNNLKLEVGAEVYYFPGIGRARDLSKLCIQGSEVLLLEMPFTQWTENIYTDVKDMIRRQRLKVVLVHIERYIEFQTDLTTWNKVLDLPVILQVNGGSIVKCLNKSEEKKSRKIEKTGGFFSKLFGNTKDNVGQKKDSGHKQKKYTVEFYEELIAKKEVFLLGSDAHNLDRRKPNVGQARKLLEMDSRFGKELLKKIDKTSDALL